MYMNTASKSSEIEREHSLVETLKKRMVEMAREHEAELTKSSDEIYLLKSKLAHYR